MRLIRSALGTHRLLLATFGGISLLAGSSLPAQSRAEDRAREREQARVEREQQRERDREERDREREKERDKNDRNRDDDRDQQHDNTYVWSGVIASGKRIIIKDINGGIDVQRSSTSRVEVTAEKRWRRGDPKEVRIEDKKVGDEVLICALWQQEATCDVDGIHSPRNARWNNKNNDVSVHFVVKVPDGVRVDVETVNGQVVVGGVTNEVRAETVNGGIEARSSGGPVRAKSVNGSIHVSMGSTGNVSDLSYETVNGSVTVELPANFGAQLELGTVNGHVTTDFPITMSGTLSPRRLRGTIGDGRTRLRASTVNGSVTLRKN